MPDPACLPRPMVSLLASALLLVGLSSTGSASAQTSPLPPATPVSYQRDFELARTALLEERDAEAAGRFDELARRAPTSEDRRVALEFAALARARIKSKAQQTPSPHIRTADELSVLYTTAFTYGFGTSTWVTLQLKPGNFAAAVLPFIAITTAAVGGVALADDSRPFRLGVPQSMAAGISLGFVEGLWLVGYQHSLASRQNPQDRWGAGSVSTVLWTSATLGGIAGATLGWLREPTPGQVAFTTSGAISGGLVSSFLGAALQGDHERRSETSFVVGAIGYNVALLSALAVSPSIRPSVARVRLVDLGGLAGSLVGVGGYLLASGNDAGVRGGLTSSALGGIVGLGLTWWATEDMPQQAHPHDTDLLSRLSPVVVPLERGVMGGLTLAL